MNGYLDLCRSCCGGCGRLCDDEDPLRERGSLSEPWGRRTMLLCSVIFSVKVNMILDFETSKHLQTPLILGQYNVVSCCIHLYATTGQNIN